SNRVCSFALAMCAVAVEPPSCDGDEKETELEALVQRLEGQLNSAQYQQKKLYSVALTGDKVTDSALKELSRFAAIDQLAIFSDDVTSDGVMHLVELPELSTLLLSSSRVTDSAVAALSKCKSLKFLSLYESPVSDDGIAALRNCKQLKH